MHALSCQSNGLSPPRQWWVFPPDACNSIDIDTFRLHPVNPGMPEADEAPPSLGESVQTPHVVCFAVHVQQQ
jgi:hypothetical protein